MKYTNKEIDELHKSFKDNGYFKITRDELVEYLLHDTGGGRFCATLNIPYEDLPLYINKYSIIY